MPDASTPPTTTGPIVLYDGLCGFCDASVQWLLKRDKDAKFRFAALQGETAAQILARHPELPKGLDSIVLV
ncbi:MAG: thiol-disulfide oxidoreductase DCC family protein, partial [Myxococcota bacterium]